MPHTTMTRTFPALDEMALTNMAQQLAMLAAAGDVLALWGGLGAGKSTFARGFLRARGIGGHIPSPTFTLMQPYPMPDGIEIVHSDLYRLKSPQDIQEIDLLDDRARRITLIEWPENMGTLLPAVRLDIHFDFTDDPQHRILSINAQGHTWQERLHHLLP